MRHFLAAGVLAALAAPALACSNDSKLPAYEREFRSQYTATRPTDPKSQPSFEYMIMGAGGALLVGATVVSMYGRRS